MSAQERGFNPQLSKEGNNWSPSVTILPHHLFQSDAIARAFMGTLDPLLSTQQAYMELDALRKTSNDPDGYFTDLLGTTQKESDIFQSNNAAFLQQIKDLPRNSTVHIDLAPDGLCKGCAIGAHCTATNMLMLGHTDKLELIKPLELEKKYINTLRQMLVDRDFLDGVDYKKLITHHVLIDFEGNLLNKPPKNPKIIPVDFNSLLVKTTAMRALFGRTDAPEAT